MRGVLRYVRLVSVLVLATWKAQAAVPDPIELLQSRQYAELEQTFQSIQNDFKRGAIDDEALLAAFRAFYDVKPPGLTARYDEWIAQFPGSYVARLACGIHYKYRADKAQDGRFRRELGDARYDELQHTQQLAAADFERSLSLDDRPLLSYMHAMDVSRYLSWRAAPLRRTRDVARAAGRHRGRRDLQARRLRAAHYTQAARSDLIAFNSCAFA